MIIWFQGISGVGKTTIAKKLYIALKKKILNIIFLDGDDFRKIMLNDIGYSLKDRNKNADRMINFVKYLSDQKMNIICSANLTTQTKRNKARKFLKNYIDIYLDTKLSRIIKYRDYKKIYSKKNLTSNVVGFDLPIAKPKNYKIIIKNNNKKDINKIVKKIYSFAMKKKSMFK